MRPPAGGSVGHPGGAGVILLVPEELRRGASRLLDTASQLKLPVIGCLSIPELGPGCGDVPGDLSGVQQMLNRHVHMLTASAAELQKRAFFADIADAMAAGIPLTSPQTAMLLKYLRQDGSLKYAPKWEREKIGEYVGKRYAKSFHDPDSFVDLAHILQHNEMDSSFSQGFVVAFGGKNLAEVPRVLQAMEYTGRMSAADARDMHVDTGLAAQLGATGYELKDDPRSLLSAFAMALAVGTSGADMNKKSNPLAQAEDDLVNSTDPWAVANLMSSGHVYGTRFLVDAFHHQILPQVAEDSMTYYEGGIPVSHLPIGGTHGHPLTGDPKTIMLNALAHNGEASAQALTTPLSESIRYPSVFGDVDSKDPMEILYNARWEDHGTAFSHVYTSATDHLQDVSTYQDADGDWKKLSSGEQQSLLHANELTYAAIDNTLHAPHQLDAMTGALANDLAHHHMTDLFTSAGRLVDGDGVGIHPDSQDPSLGGLNITSERDLLKAISEQPDADRVLQGGATAHQAQVILDNTRGVPRDGHMTWVSDITSYNALNMNAHDMTLHDQFDSHDAKHDVVFKVAHGTASLILGVTHVGSVPGVSFTVDQGIDAMAGATAPSADALSHQVGVTNGATLDSMHAAIMAGYHENHQIQAPKDLIVHHQDGSASLINYADIKDPHTVQAYHDWMYRDQLEDPQGHGAANPGRFIDPVRHVVTDSLVQVEERLPDVG